MMSALTCIFVFLNVIDISAIRTRVFIDLCNSHSKILKRFSALCWCVVHEGQRPHLHDHVGEEDIIYLLSPLF